jgi:hypothetical protein
MRGFREAVSAPIDAGRRPARPRGLADELEGDAVGSEARVGIATAWPPRNATTWTSSGASGSGTPRPLSGVPAEDAQALGAGHDGIEKLRVVAAEAERQGGSAALDLGALAQEPHGLRDMDEDPAAARRFAQ